MQKACVLGAVFLATIFLVGCSIAPTKAGGGGAQNTPADITASPNPMDFGPVADGSTKTASLVVSNPSTTGVTVSQATVTGAAFSLSSVPTLPVVLAAGQSLTLGLTFSPTAGGTANGSLSIVSNAGNANLAVSLTGNGLVAGQLAVSPTKMAFGSIAVGSTAAKNGALTAGSSSITVSTIDQTAQDYTVSGITFPTTIPAGQSVPFTVTFGPQAAGSFPGTITFISDATNTPTLTLSGTGTQAMSHSVSLSWADSQQVTGYNVYRGTQPGGPYTKQTGSPLTVTDYVDNTVQSGATYYYVATAVDANGESGYSNQASAVVP